MLLPDTERLKRGRAAVIECPVTDCRKCVSACGFTAIAVGEDGRPFSDPDKCVGCGGCAAICPEMAIRLLKDRGDGTYEVTVPFEGALPEIDDTIGLAPFGSGEPAQGRVIQPIPKRPGAFSALVRAVAPAEIIGG